jgi:phospholipase C
MRAIPIVLLCGLACACGSSGGEPSTSNPGTDGGLDSSLDASSVQDGAAAGDSRAPSRDGSTPADGSTSDAPSGSDAMSQTDGPSSCSQPIPDPYAGQRTSCTFAAGAKTLDTLGITPAIRSSIPIKHVVVVTEENRSYDHFFGQLHTSGQPDSEPVPAGYTNPTLTNTPTAPFHGTSACLPNDPPHQGAAMQASWDKGKMDGFVQSAAQAGEGDGTFVMSYYDSTDLPFLYWLANTYTIADHYFASVLGGTWGNRDYLYCATSNGVTDTGMTMTPAAPTIFDALDTAHVTWGVYSDATPRQDCIGWTSTHAGFADFHTFVTALAAGTLPQVTFVDPAGAMNGNPTQDEHPTNDIHGGEQWIRTIYETALASPLWDQIAVIVTFDEAGGLADHLPPPSACPPSASQAAFNQLGVRIPTIVMSPWARLHTVSHVVHDHTSVLRFIETLFDMPALTARDANADALLDMFDFGCPARTGIPTAPQAGALTGCQ